MPMNGKYGDIIVMNDPPIIIRGEREREREL